MKIKLSKFEISQKVTFGGCNVQASSKKDSFTISPEDNKIEELLTAPHPKTRKQAQSLVGSLNQLAAWCPGLKRKMSKLRKLHGSGIFKWTDLHNKELEKVKNSLRDHIKLSPFKVEKPVHLHINVSQEGLGYLLSHPIEEDKEDIYRMKRQLITLGHGAVGNPKQI